MDSLERIIQLGSDSRYDLWDGALHGAVVEGDFGGHTFAVVTTPAPSVVAIATTNDRRLRLANMIGRSYLLSNPAERAEALARLREIYEGASSSGKMTLDRLAKGQVEGYSDAERQFVGARFYRNVALFDAALDYVRQLGYAHIAESVAEKLYERLRVYGLEGNKYISIGPLTQKELKGKRKRRLPGLRLVCRRTADGYRLRGYVAPKLALPEPWGDVLYYGEGPQEISRTRARWMVMRDRTVRRRTGIGWTAPLALFIGAAVYPFGLLLLVHPASYERSTGDQVIDGLNMTLRVKSRGTYVLAARGECGTFCVRLYDRLEDTAWGEFLNSVIVPETDLNWIDPGRLRYRETATDFLVDTSPYARDKLFHRLSDEYRIVVNELVQPGGGWTEAQLADALYAAAVLTTLTPDGGGP